ncbi:sensor histidine kinase [Agrococcus carbonis]|uniref:histidine kinase n=1 Tax=Agrococcus carbonis TaxID=684552 RepID=A0A1H1KW89_9MICO|nr:HAMP domain-containing sensor histidine kinase [Agrococcus carbonis]SDR66631.1 His Kinase A (phospho-acceptor) domain-containing protein [Agrococcus carbonis]
MIATASRVRTGTVRPDRTRERATAVNQLLLAAAALAAAGLVVVLADIEHGDILFLGVLSIFGLTVAALVVPWNRIHPRWVGAIPIGDMAAIFFLQRGEPDAQLWLLWMVPATWLATIGGWRGLVIGAAGSSVLFWIATALHGEATTPVQMVLGPLAISVAAIVAFVASRRAAAQRALLDEQAEYLDHAVERARRQEDAVSELLDAVDFGVVRISADGSISIENDAHSRLHAIESEGQLYEADGVTRMDASQAPLARARRGATFENVLYWQGPPGEDRRALQATARRLIDVDGTDVGVILVTRDVTAERLAVAMRDELVASVSHELRTPLTSVLGHLDLALEDPDVGGAARRSLEIAERNASRLLVIIGDVLAATAEGPGRFDVRPVEEDLASVVLASVEALEHKAEARGIRIDASGVEPAVAHIDPIRIRQVVDNLVGNAVSYHTGDGLIEVGVTCDDKHAWLVVRDDGPGIAEDVLPHLFERRFRAESAQRSRPHGNGLGLAISRDLVRAHGGEITVQSEPAAGATFVVRLPLRRAGATA